MKSKPILILTHAKDDCAALVMSHLTSRGHDFIRFDTETFHTKVRTTMELTSDGKVTGRFIFPCRDINFADIGVVWNRRVHAPELGSELDYEPELKTWAIEETVSAFNMAFTLIPCPIVNPFEINERLKFNKMLQMQRAAAIGLEVPYSSVTDVPEEISKFWGAVDGDVIFKKLRKGLLFMKDGRRLLFHTSVIPRDRQNEATIRRMRFTPVFLERHIPKQYDIRSVVVGGQVFSVAIHSQSVPEGRTDYRTASVLGKMDKMPHEIIDLGDEVNSKLVAFTRSFGLTFSVIDLVRTPDGRLVFLEDNPNGQWAWLEMKTGIPIAKAIAEHLVSIAEGQS